jgi:hypothetical protein
VTDQIRPVPEPDFELIRALVVADAICKHRPETAQDRQQLERMRAAPDRESLLEAFHEYGETMHVPTDAGVWEEGLVGILRRIPPRWGRWIRVDKGWYSIIVRCDRDLARLDPNYEVHQVKQKYGGLRYYFSASTEDEEVRQAMLARAGQAEAEAATTCERCGRSRGGAYRPVGAPRGWRRTLCDGCAHTLGYEREPEHPESTTQS